jgi:hypothetical protein
MHRQSTAIGAAILLVSLAAAAWTALRQPKPAVLIPTLSGQPEYCLTCHAGLREISPSHPVKTFGCVSCHGGERLALNAALAHSTMRGGSNPADLSVVGQSCGGSLCHSGTPEDQRDHIQRVMTSVQATYAGAIANILYTFGSQADLRARFGIETITDDRITTSTGVPALAAFDPALFNNPSVSEFASNCLTCHINATPVQGQEYSRFTGCAACHSPMTPDERLGRTKTTHVLTTAIPYAQCDTCHNRGNYDLRSMTFVARADQPADRLHSYYQPIAQFTKCEYTLDCVDCHTRTEVMGDGDIHSTKKEIQYIQCRTCHGTPTELPSTTILTDPNDIAFREARLNPILELSLGATVIVTDKGEPLWNTRVLPDGSYELVAKATGQHFKFRPVKGSGCTQDPSQQASQYCHECHSVQH